MKTRFVYPGSFDPPTYGHLHIARQAALIFPSVEIICSRNTDKKSARSFPLETCRDLWNGFDLPKNVFVRTIDEIRRDPEEALVMIRGLRNGKDMEHERRVMDLNRRTYGIERFLYLLSEDGFGHVSSSAAREAAARLDFQRLAEYVPPHVVTALLERTLEAKNVFLVIGRPGSGKSTFLGKLCSTNPDRVHIETDRFLDGLRPAIGKRFGSEADPIGLALERSEALTRFVAPYWFESLRKALLSAPPGSDIFIEAAYGLQPGKDLFRFLGDKIIHFACGNADENRRRLRKRGTEEHLPFIEAIPGPDETESIARSHRLRMRTIRTDTNGHGLHSLVETFSKTIKKEARQ